MKYFEEAKAIWINQVPKSGQADTVEGELIRAIEKLRHESHNNGNGNWDEGFQWFLEYINETLHDTDVFNNAELKDISEIIERLSNYDFPYLEDDLYDHLADYAVMWSRAKNGPVAREHDSRQYR